MNIFIAVSIVVKPEHSLYDAIFWLLALLAVLVAAVALKVIFGIVDREIELWRARHKRKAKHRHPEKEEGLY